MRKLFEVMVLGFALTLGVSAHAADVFNVDQQITSVDNSVEAGFRHGHRDRRDHDRGGWDRDRGDRGGWDRDRGGWDRGGGGGWRPPVFERYDWVFESVDNNGCHSCQYSCYTANCDRYNEGARMACNIPGTRNDQYVYRCQRTR